MKLVKAKIFPKARSMTENRRILEAFIAQDEEVMEVLDWVTKTAASAAGSLNNSIRTLQNGRYACFFIKWTRLLSQGKRLTVIEEDSKDIWVFFISFQRRIMTV